MSAAIPAHEMAETLCILAGSNAGNAARHFGKQCYEAGDIAAAVLWSSIAQALDRMPSAARAPAETVAMQPVPRRMTGNLEAAAFEGVRFEDVDGDVLVREGLQETLAAISERTAGEPKANFQHAEYGAALGTQEISDQPRKLELVSTRAPQPQPQTADSPSRRPSRPIWSRIVKHSSRRIAA